MTTSATIDVRRAAERFTTRLPCLESHHSFSFSRHYDPANPSHGLLVVNDDDGDAVGLTAAGVPALTAGAGGPEVLLWEMA